MHAAGNTCARVVTDRRATLLFYCMSEEGIIPANEPLSYEEMLRPSGLLATMGVRKQSAPPAAVSPVARLAFERLVETARH
jgi:hypothetical protein